MNKRILRLAVPNIISNITIPLLGIVDLAIAGHIGHELTIGAIAIGAAIFNFIYWNFGFIRMGTSGLTAQAFGARRLDECANILGRSVIVALLIGVLLIVFNRWVGTFSLGMMNGSEGVMQLAAQYFFARIWAVPAGISLFAIHGWFIGMQNSTTPMTVSIVMNLVNIACSVWFVFGLDLGIPGIGWSKVVAQNFGLLLSWILWFAYYGRFRKYFDLRKIFKPRMLAQFFNVSKDIFVRTACIVIVYTFFTSASSGMGDTMLAANALLMQLFTLFSYMSDGMSYAAEALIGRYYGARNANSLWHAVRNLFWWSFGIAAAYMLVYVVWWRDILGLFTDSQAIVDIARHYIVWVILVPLIGFAPFLMDGIMIGATKTKVLRDSVFLAMGLFFAAWYGLRFWLDNDALWLAFIVFLFTRGVFQLWFSDRLRILTPPANIKLSGNA